MDLELLGLSKTTPQGVAPTSTDRGVIVGQLGVAGGTSVRYLTGASLSLSSNVPANTAVGDLLNVSAYSSTSAKYPATWKCTSISASLPSGATAGDVTGNALGALYVLKTGSTYYKFELVGDIHVNAFGALADGIADDTNAINAAIAYGDLQGRGALVLFGIGSYLISQTLTPTIVSMKGVGRKSTKIAASASLVGRMIVYDTPNPGTWGFVKDLFLDCDDVATDGLYFNRQGWTAENLWVQDATQYGIHARGFSSRIVNCYVEGCGSVGIYTNPVGGNIIVDKCFVRDCPTNYRINTSDQHAMTGCVSQEATVQEVLIESTSSEQHSITIRDCYFETTVDIPHINITNTGAYGSYPVLIDGNFFVGRVAHTVNPVVYKNQAYVIFTNNWISAMPYVLFSNGSQGGAVRGNMLTVSVGAFWKPGSTQDNFEVGFNRGGSLTPSLPGGFSIGGSLTVNGTAAGFGIAAASALAKIHAVDSANASRLEITGSGVNANYSRTSSVGNNSTHCSTTFTNSDSTVASINTVNRTGGTTSTGTGYELRLTAAGAGYISLYTNSLQRVQVLSTGVVRPGADNTQSLGDASNRWSVVYAGTGTINTSDGREKTPIRALKDREISAAKQLGKEIGAFTFLSAKEEKGNAAREHIGMAVQRAIEVMESHNLDPFNYGFICYDEWDEVTEQVPVEGGAEGETTTVVKMEAGNRYSFRTDELALFILAGLSA